jgi:hypothetical protein
MSHDLSLNNMCSIILSHRTRFVDSILSNFTLAPLQFLKRRLALSLLVYATKEKFIPKALSSSVHLGVSIDNHKLLICDKHSIDLKG